MVKVRVLGHWASVYIGGGGVSYLFILFTAVSTTVEMLVGTWLEEDIEMIFYVGSSELLCLGQ